MIRVKVSPKAFTELGNVDCSSSDEPAQESGMRWSIGDTERSFEPRGMAPFTLTVSGPGASPGKITVQDGVTVCVGLSMNSGKEVAFTATKITPDRSCRTS